MSYKPVLDRSVEAGTLMLPFAVSQGLSKSKIKNVEWSWDALCERLQKSTRDQKTLEAFSALPVDVQLDRKNNGYFVGGPFQGNRRKKANIDSRSMLVIDIDACATELLDALKNNTSGLGRMAYAVYSTRKHSLEHPRIRIVIPLLASVDHDSFVALTRFVAAMIDPQMETVDPVSFRIAQFMYWPSHCADQEPFYYHNDGYLLDGEATLNKHWPSRELSLLPKSLREHTIRNADGGKADPRTKKNFVGAFCRLFDCRAVIDEFLDDLYTPSESDSNGLPIRYTYTEGTTSNGLVVYDEGLHVSSFQGSDPIANEGNPNAFDFCRVHMFGHLDDDLPDGTLARERPSYKAMVKKFSKLPEMREELFDNKDFPVKADDAFDDIELPEADAAFTDPEGTGTVEKQSAIAVTVPGEKGWDDALAKSEKGEIKRTVNNIVLILTHAPTFAGVFAYSEFVSTEVIAKSLVCRQLNRIIAGPNRLRRTVRIGQDAVDLVKLILEMRPGRMPNGARSPGWGLTASDDQIAQAIRLVAQNNRIHPVRDWLTKLEGTWDGKPRVEQLWIKGCHTPDTPYYRETARILLLAAVTRIFEPGCKYDFACIIEGDQGTRKSTFVRTLGGMWSGDTEGHFANENKFVESTLGKWIIEIPELVHFGKAEIQAIKHALSRTEETVRLAFERFVATYPRQSVFVGTTNEDKYLRDPTGGRRFIPIKMGPGVCDVEWLIANRLQIFAEAMHIYRAARAAQPHGELPLYQMDDQQAKIEQAARQVDDGHDSWVGVIREYMNAKVPQGQQWSGDAPPDVFEPDAPLVFRRSVCALEIAVKVLNGDRSRYGRAMADPVCRAIRQIAKEDGWEEVSNLRCGEWGRQRAWRRVGNGPLNSDDDL